MRSLSAIHASLLTRVVLHHLSLRGHLHHGRPSAAGARTAARAAARPHSRHSRGAGELRGALPDVPLRWPDERVRHGDVHVQEQDGRHHQGGLCRHAGEGARRGLPDSQRALRST